MKGCARGALLQLAGYLATAGLVMFVLQQRYGYRPSQTIGVSIFAGFFAFLAGSFLVAIGKPVRERSQVRECLAGRRPADGKRASFVGTIEALGEKLRSPLSDTDSVAWKYDVHEFIGHGKSRRKVTYFEGLALAPSVINTPFGSVRLLAVPEFDTAPEALDPVKAARVLSEHAKTAAFEGEANRGDLAQQWTDDDGSFRRERRYAEKTEAELAACRLREDLIRSGDEVYVVGLHSEARDGIVPDPNWAKETRIMKGDGNSVLVQLRQRIVRYFAGSVLTAAGALALLWMFLSSVHKP